MVLVYVARPMKELKTMANGAVVINADRERYIRVMEHAKHARH